MVEGQSTIFKNLAISKLIQLVLITYISNATLEQLNFKQYGKESNQKLSTVL